MSGNRNLKFTKIINLKFINFAKFYKILLCEGDLDTHKLFPQKNDSIGIINGKWYCWLDSKVHTE